MPGQQRLISRFILLLASALWMLPFLVAEHSLPLTTFYPELFAIAITACLFLAVLILQAGKPGTLPLPAVLLAPTAFGAVLFVQLAMTRDSRPVPTFLAVFFLLCVVLALQAGAWLGQDREFSRSVLRACAIGSLMGGLLSAAIAWTQAFSMESHYAGWIAEYTKVEYRRPFAHLFQPNHLGTVLSLSMISALYLRQIRVIGWTVLVIALFMLGIGVALTSSRTAWLQIAVILAGSIALAAVSRQPGANRLSQRDSIAPGLVLLAAVAAAQLLVTWLNRDFGLQLSASAAARLAETDATSPRLQLWRYAADIFLQHPLIGSGWGEFVHAQYLAADRLGQVEMANNAHNIVLDLLAKTGVLGAAAVLIPCTGWAVRVIKAIRMDSDALNRVFCLVLVAVVLVHAMLEYPQNYAFFLLPVCLMLGLAETENWKGITRALSLTLSTAMVLSVSIGLVAGYYDYKKIEVAYEQNGAFRYAADPALIFGDWGRFGLVGMMSLDKELLAEKIEMHEHAIALAASPNYIRRYIILLALDDRADDALLQVKRLRGLTPGSFDRQYAWLVAMCDEQNDALNDFKSRLLRTYGQPKHDKAAG